MKTVSSVADWWTGPGRAEEQLSMPPCVHCGRGQRWPLNSGRTSWKSETRLAEPIP